MKTHSAITATVIFLFGISTAMAGTTLKGRFGPGNETTLINQLTPLGYEYFSSYRHNPDGSAAILALDQRISVKNDPTTIISVSKDGVAVATEPEMNGQLVTEEPQSHFVNAAAANVRKDYKAVATEIRKAAIDMRLESANSSGTSKQKLDSSFAKLDALSAAAEKAALKEEAAHEDAGNIGTFVERGLVRDERSIALTFAKANNALALAHHVKAAEALAKNDYKTVGKELNASAHAFESAAGWIGAEEQKAKSVTVADARVLGDKLASNAVLVHVDVVKGLESLGKEIHSQDQKIDSADSTKSK